MEIGTAIHGFILRRSRPVPTAKAVLEEWEHVKSGARLCRLDREDENKSFAIGFRTVPEDDTGVFHIIEHSVLCGSDKYPVKEPFVELLKGSLQTFLNALTYPDKTVYPVASRNDKDFLNLVDVYMDAVLHPAIYHVPEIFAQEGWHVELTDEKAEPSFKGVVFNEMKGAYSSVDRLLDRAACEALFPDTTYARSSGGDPAHITDLTYEGFIAAHKRFYHPSNSYIVLDGSIDLQATFALLDSYLSAYDRIDPRTEIPMQAPVASRTVTIPYEIAAEEEKENKTILSWNRICGTYADKKEMTALNLVCTVLTSSNEAPLTRALLEADLCEDVSLYVDSGTQQCVLTLCARNTELQKKDAIEALCRKVFAEQADGALDHKELIAEFNAIEFKLREHDSGSTPLGLTYGLGLYDTWLYGGDPMDALEYETTFAELRAAIDTGYYEDIIRRYLLTTDNIVTVIALPDENLGAQKAQEEAARVRAKTAAWGDEDRRAAVETTQALIARQQTPDTPQALAALPHLTLDDINVKGPTLVPLTETVGDVTHLYYSEQDVHTDGILYLRLYFEAGDVAYEDLPALSILCDYLGELGTKKTDALTLQRELTANLGRFNVDPDAYTGTPEDPTCCRFRLTVSTALLEGNVDRAVELITEILTETDFDCPDRIKEMLLQDKTDLKQRFIMRGHAVANRRRKAYFTAEAAAEEAMDGYDFYVYLKDLCEHFDEKFPALRDSMQRLAKTFFTAGRMTVSSAGKLDRAPLERLIRNLPGEKVAPTYAKFKPLGVRREGIEIPAPIAFTSTGGYFYKYTPAFTGQMIVASQLCELTHLWNTVRVQGGAYGTGMTMNRPGDLAVWSYRDPDPIGAICAANQIQDFLDDFCKSDEDLTPYVIGSLGAVDPLETPRSATAAADIRWLKGLTCEKVEEKLREIVHTTKADLADLVPIIEDTLNEAAVCIVAGKDKLAKCKKAEIIETILSI